MRQVKATVIENKGLLPGHARRGGRALSSTHLIWLNSPEIARPARPGQFVMVRCGEDCLLPRPFSVHRVDRDNLALLFAVLEQGKGTSWLAQREAGNPVELFGPLGNGFSVHPDAKNLLLVAGGIGIAPLHFLAQEALKLGCSVRLLYGAATAAQLYPARELPDGADKFLFTEDGTSGERGLVTDYLPAHTDWADQVFACGPPGMYQDMARKERELGLEGKAVQISLEARMGCGRGVCYGCTVRTKNGLKRVCQDGPVFELTEILGDKLI